MVAGGVGLAPVPDARRSARRAQNAGDALLRRAHAPTVLHRPVRRLGVRIMLATEDGSVGVNGLITVPLEDALRAPAARAAGQAVRLRPDADDAALRAARRTCTAAPATSRSNRSWDAASAAATAASCRRARDGGRRTTPARASTARSSTPNASSGRRVATLTMDLSASRSDRFDAPESTDRRERLFRLRRRIRRRRRSVDRSAASPSKGCSSPNAKGTRRRASSKPRPAC